MKFVAEIRAAAIRHQVPFTLLCEQVRQESNFNPLAVSHCGARGLLQIMPATGAELGLKEHEFFDVEKNLNAGALYMHRMHRAVQNFIVTLRNAQDLCTEGDYWLLALASYNGGLGYVIKAMNLCKVMGISINWENVATFLKDERCTVRGRRPDHRQIIHYVETIWSHYRDTVQAGGMNG